MKSIKKTALILFIAHAVCLTGALGAHGWRKFTDYRRDKLDLRLASLLKAARDCKRDRGAFPTDFTQVAVRVWPDAARGRASSVVRGNYAYLYKSDGKDFANLWAVPLGPNASTAKTVFVAFTIDGERVWKGPVVPPERVGLLEQTPSAALLASLGMVEEKARK